VGSRGSQLKTSVSECLFFLQESAQMMQKRDEQLYAEILEQSHNSIQEKHRRHRKELKHIKPKASYKPTDSLCLLAQSAQKVQIPEGRDVEVNKGKSMIGTSLANKRWKRSMSVVVEQLPKTEPLEPDVGDISLPSSGASTPRPLKDVVSHLDKAGIFIPAPIRVEKKVVPSPYPKPFQRPANTPPSETSPPPRAPSSSTSSSAVTPSRYLSWSPSGTSNSSPVAAGSPGALVASPSAPSLSPQKLRLIAFPRPSSAAPMPKVLASTRQLVTQPQSPSSNPTSPSRPLTLFSSPSSYAPSITSPSTPGSGCNSPAKVSQAPTARTTSGPHSPSFNFRRQDITSGNLQRSAQARSGGRQPGREPSPKAGTGAKLSSAPSVRPLRSSRMSGGSSSELHRSAKSLELPVEEPGAHARAAELDAFLQDNSTSSIIRRMMDPGNSSIVANALRNPAIEPPTAQTIQAVRARKAFLQYKERKGAFNTVLRMSGILAEPVTAPPKKKRGASPGKSQKARLHSGSTGVQAQQQAEGQVQEAGGAACPPTHSGDDTVPHASQEVELAGQEQPTESEQQQAEGQVQEAGGAAMPTTHSGDDSAQCSPWVAQSLLPEEEEQHQQQPTESEQPKEGQDLADTDTSLTNMPDVPL
ncbi:hypothetical protein CYMTET_52585, partial [Cymbomonas tetramitiformis]